MPMKPIPYLAVAAVTVTLNLCLGEGGARAASHSADAGGAPSIRTAPKKAAQGAQPSPSHVRSVSPSASDAAGRANREPAGGSKDAGGDTKGGASEARGSGTDAKATSAETKGSATDPKLSTAEADVAAAVSRVQANYEKVRSFRARFKQDYWVKVYDQRKKSAGAVVFARPGKMSWTYDDPKGNRVVSDGKLLRVYEDAAKQLYEQAVDRSQYPQALGFLTGESRLSETFSFEVSDGVAMNFPGGMVLVGTPKQPLASVQKVLLYVDRATHYVRRVLLLDAQGNRNRFDFDEVRLDDAIDAREFAFTAPAGTTVIHP